MSACLNGCENGSESGSVNGRTNGCMNGASGPVHGSMRAVVNVVAQTVAEAYVLTGHGDRTLLDDLAALRTGDRITTAVLLAHLAEVDARRLYLPAAYPSMYLYCMRELGFSEQAAFKRIHAARTARKFPALFPALAEGRLHLTAVGLLAPHLTAENVDELVAGAAHRSKAEIDVFLARRFPRSELLAWVEDLEVRPSPAERSDEPAGGPAGARGELLSPERVGTGVAPLSPERVGTGDMPLSPERVGTGGMQLSPERVGTGGMQLSPERVGALKPLSRIAPLAARRFGLQVTIGQGTHDKLRHIQDLLGPRGRDLADVLDQALDAYIARLERQKFAATERPRPAARRASTGGRYVPADVKRAVWARDGGRCTFASNSGKRCPARTSLEYDHVDPVARGGYSTMAGLRLRCRAHNQYEAECAFGAEFMRRKREQARQAAAEARVRRSTTEARTRRAAEEGRAPHAAETERSHATEEEARQRAAEAERLRAEAEARARAVAAALEVVPWLRALGIRAEEARRAAALCESIPDASLEERVRVALRGLRPRAHVTSRVRGCVGILSAPRHSSVPT